MHFCSKYLVKTFQFLLVASATGLFVVSFPLVSKADTDNAEQFEEASEEMETIIIEPETDEAGEAFEEMSLEDLGDEVDFESLPEAEEEAVIDVSGEGGDEFFVDDESFKMLEEASESLDTGDGEFEKTEEFEAINIKIEEDEEQANSEEENGDRNELPDGEGADAEFRNIDPVTRMEEARKMKSEDESARETYDSSNKRWWGRPY